MHGLDTPQKDPRGTVTIVIGVVVAVYLLAMVAWKIWQAFH